MDTGNGPDLEFGFLLHDIGKIAISDAILYKPGRSPTTSATRCAGTR